MKSQKYFWKGLVEISSLTVCSKIDYHWHKQVRFGVLKVSIECF